MIYGVTTILSRMLNFIMTPIFTSSFATSVYGILTNLYAYASFVNAVLAFGMETTFFRYLQKVEGDKKKVFDTSFFITLIAAFLFLITVFIFSTPIASLLSNGEELSDYTTYVKYFAVMLAADAVAVIPFAKLRAEGRPIRYSLIKSLNIVIYVTCVLILLYVFPKFNDQYSFINSWYREGWLGNVFLANVIASVLTVVLLLPQMMGFRFRVERKLLKSMLNYSFPILIANISFIINENLDKMIIPMLLPEDGNEETGSYGAATKIAVFLSLFVTAFRLGAEPFFFSHAKHENARKTYAGIMEYFVIGMLIVMIGICANLSWLKNFIRGQEDQLASYWSGLYIVPFILFNYVLLGIYMNLSVWYKLSDQTRYGLYISGIGAIITIILNFGLIPSYSYQGAVFATTCAYLSMLGLSYFWGQKNYPIPYPVKKIVIYLIVGSGTAWLASNQGFWIGNVLLLVFVSVVFYLEKNNLKKFIRN